MRNSRPPRTRGRSRKGSPSNTTNRVFESSGPDGKVRGNSLQIIEKYQAMARDALLGGDRIVAENYTQHAEHYIRLLEKQKENENLRSNAAHSRQVNGKKAPVQGLEAPVEAVEKKPKPESNSLI